MPHEPDLDCSAPKSPPQLTHSPLLPWGQPRGHHSLCHPAPLPPPSTARPPKPIPAPNLPSAAAPGPPRWLSHGQAAHWGHGRGQGTGNKDRGSPGQAPEGRGAAGVTPAVLLRGSRDIPAFPSAGGTQGTLWGHSGVRHGHVSQLAMARAPPATTTHTRGVFAMPRCGVCISCSSPAEAFLLVYWSSPPVTGSQSSRGAFISWGHLAFIRTCCY